MKSVSAQKVSTAYRTRYIIFSGIKQALQTFAWNYFTEAFCFLHYFPWKLFCQWCSFLSHKTTDKSLQPTDEPEVTFTLQSTLSEQLELKCSCNDNHFFYTQRKQRICKRSECSSPAYHHASSWKTHLLFCCLQTMPQCWAEIQTPAALRPVFPPLTLPSWDGVGIARSFCPR